MNTKYSEIRQGLEEVEISDPDLYIERGLAEFGYDSFPESGLSDRGKSKLLKTILKIYQQESDLSLNYKTKIVKKDGKVLIQKEKRRRPKKQPKDLEAMVFRDDLEDISNFFKKNIPKAVRGVAKTIAYPIGTNLAIPTMWRKAYNFSDGLAAAGCFLGEFGFPLMYALLNSKHPELILPMALTQVATNLVSGAYEWRRSIKKRAEKIRLKQDLNLIEMKKTAINTPTSESYGELMRVYEVGGWYWNHGDLPSKGNMGHSQDKLFCVDAKNKFASNCESSFKNKRYKIISPQEFYEAQKITPEMIQRINKVFE